MLEKKLVKNYQKIVIKSQGKMAQAEDLGVVAQARYKDIYATI